MVGKEHPHSRENRILNIRAVSAPPEHSTQRRMNMIAKTILEQIGGRRFAAMTGSKDFIDMGNGLRMSLARNKTSANRLDIIYDAGADLYNMRFYRRTFSKKTFECKTKDIETHEGIYCDMLEEMFTMVTGLYTRFLREVGGESRLLSFMSMMADKKVGKETFVLIYDSIYKNKFLSWKQSDRTEKLSCTAMTEQA